VPDVPPQLAAALLPRYCIERELGVGGMATVYLARDVRHQRDVAIKVLNRELADAIGADRFIAEIRTTAHLRHPHILPLFDSGAADGLPFYVMPFVDGESLRSRLHAQGRLSTADAVRILREVADALAHAHALGIVHRDVKPDNVLMSGRHAFLADFGVARAVAAHVGQDQTVTGTGVMIGTPAYMAPEQITGGAIDRRSDIYAFGVMAYELLAGTPPFRGARQDVVTAQLTEAPAQLSTLRPDTPAPLARAIMQCLQKKPDHRWQRIDDLFPVLDVSTGADSVVSTSQWRVGGRLRWWPLAAGFTIAVALAAGYYARYRTNGPPTSLSVGKLIRVTSEVGLELDPAISPDGRAIAYAAGVLGHMRVCVRQISGGRMVPLTDDESSGSQRWPQWSPDGARILFQAGRPHLSTRSQEGTSLLFEVPALGGVATRIAAEFLRGVAISPSWSRDGRRIAFGGADGLYVIDSENGKSPTLLAPAQEVTSPAWSPDGRRIAFVSRGIFFTFGEESFGNVSTSTIFVVDVDSRKTIRVTSGDWLDINPVWMPDGRTLLFISGRGGGRDVFRQRLDGAGQPMGEPDRVTSGLNAHGISVSRDGRLLAYSAYVQRANIWSVPIPTDRMASVREARQVTFGTEKIEKLAISRDGRWLAYDSDRNGQPDIWKMPVAGGTPEQVTRGPNNKFVNDWSPDGQEIAYHSMREGGQRDVMVVSADGMSTEVVANSPAEEQHSAWGPDGNSIIYDHAASTDLQNQIYLVRRARRGAPWGTPKRLTSDGSSDPKWSPDGRHIVYCVRGELRIMAPDGTGQRTVVPDSPGQPRPAYPIWSRDSRTIYYKAYDAQLQSSIWSVSVDGGRPRLLVTFDDPSRRSMRREFTTDDQRFYFTIESDESDLWAMELISK
jgi:eukaryotic-like serine/threonine-protein kinase